VLRPRHHIWRSVRVFYPTKPRWDDVLAVSANVRVDNNDSEKAGQRYQYHVHAEIRAYHAHTRTVKHIGLVNRKHGRPGMRIFLQLRDIVSQKLTNNDRLIIISFFQLLLF
jgi:hypothetical protein